MHDTRSSVPQRQQGAEAGLEPVRLGAVGLGAWSRTLAQAYRGSDRVDLVACYSRDQERRRSFAEEFGCDASASLDDLLSREDVEGVIITVPNDQHAAICVQAAMHGKHVFVEKPIAIAPSHIVDISKAVTATNVIFACGHTARRLSGIREMKRRLESGALGRPSMVEAFYGNPRGLDLLPDDWRADPVQSPGGPLTQIGIHHIDNLQYLFGPVQRVMAMGRAPRPEIANLLAVGILLEFEDVLGHLGTDWMTPGTFAIDAHCHRARLRYELDYRWWGRSSESDAHSTLVQYGPEAGGDGGGGHGGAMQVVPLAAGNHLREEVEEFAAAIRGDAEVEVGLDASIANVAVLLSVVRSLEEHRPIEVAECRTELTRM